MAEYKNPFAYKLIYIMSIPDEAHKGLLKIGETTLSTTLGSSQLVDNCDALNAAAHERIKQYTKTALIKYDLLHTEISMRRIVMDDGSVMLSPFGDDAVHRVLWNSGYLSRKFPDSDEKSEWFNVDLQTAINAIRAYKDGRNSLYPSEKTSEAESDEKVEEEEFPFREEQIDAVDRALTVFSYSDKMLWNCKMRFGKTVSAYELIKKGNFQKTIIVTHRPVVEEGWREDHDKIFGKNSEHIFATKAVNSSVYEYDEKIDTENDRMLRNYDKKGVSFAYFCSMQDLRGSKIVGGNFEKNNAVFELDWDLIIYDEAHEGTQTEIGTNVRELLEQPQKGKKPKVLALSGTPYNIYEQYGENVYTWDYVMEQQKKKDYAQNHPDLPNPYKDLPEMRILTFDLQNAMQGSYRYETVDAAFNFREFFRTWTGDPALDFRHIPAGAEVGDFVHERDVNNFLDLITTESEESKYPFSSQEYRDMFKHTFWMVPGVKEAKALSKLLNKHPVFKNYKVANVAGEGDEEKEYDDALKEVEAAIRKNPYTITISCGRLTTGVTVPEWSAVMMLTGSSSTSASGYMQTIFRVQSVGSVDGQQKQVAYVFDFAPDRALKVLTEVHSITNKGNSQDEKAKLALGEFLNFCPVIAVDGTRMTPYDVPHMMRQLKKMSVDKAIKSGFEDDSIYKEDVGIVMDENDQFLFNLLASRISAQSKGKKTNKITINEQGFTNEEYKKAEKIKNKPKRELTPEEKELLAKRRKLREDREKVLRLLRAVSIRLPLLFYGADVDINDNIQMEDFVKIVDDESWQEFLPQGIDKGLFKSLIKYYDEDVIMEAGYRIRRMAKAADELPPTERVKQIAEIFSLFHNPDKETVLTPWRVVNMHMGDTIGGFNFFEEGYPQESNLEIPRLIDKGKITADLFKNPDAKLLEMNSKSGLYPLYLAYSAYAMKLPKPENQMDIEETQKIWRETLEQNIFVLCKTEMAKKITIRTLAGYQENWKVNAIYLTKLLDRMDDKERLKRKLTNPETWGKDGERMKFDTVVGNPPYQLSDGGFGISATPIYDKFIEMGKKLSPKYLSMIVPARWYAGGKGLDDFRDEMLHDRSIREIHDFPEATDCFQGVQIKGGICYFLWDRDSKGDCKVFTHRADNVSEPMTRPLLEEGCDTFIRYNDAIGIVHKVMSFNEPTMDKLVSSRQPFGLSTTFHGHDKENKSDIKIYENQGVSYTGIGDITKNQDDVFKWKVIIPRSGSGSDAFPHPILGVPFVGNPGTACSETYIYIGPFENEEICKNVISYISTKFLRSLAMLKKVTQSTTKNIYTLVPQQDFSKSWTDEELYKKYNLSDDEIAFIESMIKPM